MTDQTYGLIIGNEPHPYIYGPLDQILRLDRANRRAGHTTTIVQTCDACGKEFPTIEMIEDDLGGFCSPSCRDEAHESDRVDWLEN